MRSQTALIIFFLTIIVIGGCKKEKGKEPLTEKDSVFISQTLKENEQKWELYLDTSFYRNNMNNYTHGAYVSEIYNPGNDYENYISYNSFFEPNDSDSVSIFIKSSFRLSTPVLTTQNYSGFTFFFKVDKNEIILKNDQFYFKNFNTLTNLLSVPNLKLWHSTNNDPYIGFSHQHLGEDWRLGINSDTSDMNNNNEYYFKITDTEVNNSEEKIYVTVEFKFPVSEQTESKISEIQGKARVLLGNLRI